MATFQQEPERYFEFLADASAKLGSTLSLGEVFSQLAGIVVPFLADWCVIDLNDKHGRIERAGVRHGDPSKQWFAQALRTYGPLESSAHPVVQAMEERRPVVVADVTDEALARMAHDEEHLRILKGLGISSILVIPLIGRERLLGAMTLVFSDDSRIYGLAEQALSEDVAQRAALAMENAKLFEDHAEIARKLQESLLPPSLPDIPGIEVGASYRASGDGIEVGGDFYDFFRSSGKSWNVVIGDVSGKGPDAAAITALARYTTRAAAMQMRTPRRILTTLNKAILGQTPPERFATVAFARIRTDPGPGAKKVTIACGGHPLPLILRCNGDIEEVGSAGTVLGVFEKIQVKDETLSLEPGDTLVLYTDGVTEARRDAQLLGSFGLHAALASCRGLGPAETAERIAKRVIDFQKGDPSDDLAIVALRVTG